MAIRLMPKRRGRKKQCHPTINIKNLETPDTQELLQTALCDSLPLENTDDIEVQWNLLKSTILTTGQAVLGLKSKRHQDLFDDNDQEIEHLISKKTAGLLCMAGQDKDKTRTSLAKPKGKLPPLLSPLLSAE